MKNNLLYQTCHKHKNITFRLFALEAVGSLLLLGASGTLAHLMESARQLSLGTGNLEAAPALLVLLFVLCLRSLARWQQKKYLNALSHHCRMDCRQKLHESLFSPAENRQEISATALETTEALDRYFSAVLPNILSILILMPIMLASALALDYVTAGLFLLTMPIAPFLLYLIGTVTRERTARQWQELLRLTSEFRELLSGMISIKLFRQGEGQKSRLARLSRDFSAASLQVLQTAFISSFALELITTLSIAIVAVSIGFRLLGGGLEFEPAFFLLLITPLYYQPLRQAGASFHAAMEARTAEKKLEKYLAEPPELAGHKGQLQIPPALRISHLSLGYEGRQQPVFQGLSLAIPAGCKALLTGPSGCGKSTLLKAIAGLSLPLTGEVLLNDSDVLKLAPVSRQKIISYLPQEPKIFSGTLAENLALFQDVPKERMVQALRLASLENWHKSLPEGLATRLGAEGISLSQGERKRLGLARLILQNRPLVLLDEPTNGLDSQTETDVLRALEAFSHRRTMLIVSHRPALRDWAEKIFNWEELLP